MQNLLEKLGLGERATSMVVWVGLSLLLLIVVVALAVWLVRTLRPTLNLSGGSGRGGRPQRLAITDAFTLDRDGRKLVIVRRDNVEHLLLIGGPNDVLVESSIVRGERSTRDRSGRGGADSDLLAAENALTDAPAPPVAPQAPMVAPPPAPIAPPVFRPAPPPVAKPVQQPAAAPRLDDDFERALSAMQNAQRQQAATSPPPAPPRPPQPAPASFTPPPAPPVATPAQPAPAPAPLPPPLPPVMAEPVPMPPPPPPLPEPPARSQPVSEMARRLNEVLQKPLSGTLRPPFNKPIPPVPGTMNSAPKPPAPPAPPALPVEAEMPLPPPPPPAPPLVPQAPAPAAPAPAAGKPGSDHEMDLLEEEMARLLGRPSQPKKPDAP